MVKRRNNCRRRLSQSRVLVIGELAGSHETLLSKYLVDRAASIAFIEVLLTRYYKPGINFLRVSCHRAGRLERSFKYGSSWGFLLRFDRTRRVFLYALSLIYITIALLKLRPKFDICVACNIPFPLIGLMLRSLGLVRKVIFISAVHFPSSLKVLSTDAIVSRTFRFIDKLAHDSCDAIWYQTSRMREIKEREGFIKNQNIPRIIVPIGVNIGGDENTTASQIERASVGYVGRLAYDIGLELAIEAFSEVVKVAPHAKFKIIGAGPTRESLKVKSQALGLERSVDFLGFIGDREKVRNALSKCAVCIAPYVPAPDNPMQYADSAKAKEYIECGTPIIITKVTEIAFEIEEKGAGFAVEYDKDQIASAMIKLLTDDKLWQECRRNIKQLAVKYDYEKIYSEAFLASGVEL